MLTFDDELTKERLDKYIGMFRFRDDPLELLTLSACETGRRRRARRSRSGRHCRQSRRAQRLATLWNINDQATSILIGEFYRQLNDPGVSRAVALQRAQLKVLADPTLVEGHIYVHPTLWSPFLLINNWL